jgi:hypothetical protein
MASELLEFEDEEEGNEQSTGQKRTAHSSWQSNNDDKKEVINAPSKFKAESTLKASVVKKIEDTS